MSIAFLYSGIIPFFLAACVVLFMDDAQSYLSYVVDWHIFFATFIIMFMVGSYWGQAVSHHSKILVLLSFGFTFVMLGLSASMIFWRSMPYASMVYIPVFWMLYFADQRFLNIDDQALPGYLRHRLIATSLLTGSLFVSTVVMEG